MAMKGYSAFPKAPALLEPHHQIVYGHILDTRVFWGGEGFTLLQGCSLCIPQLQPTGQIDIGTGELGNKRTSGDHSNYSIIKIG